MSLKALISFNFENNAIILLYSVLFIEIISFWILGYQFLSLILITLSSIGIIIKRLINRNDSINWEVIKTRIIQIFLKNDIISEQQNNSTIILLPRSEVLEPIDKLIVFEDLQIIEDLREVGLDAILVCLFLLTRQDASCSANTIHKNLKIPMTTLYRNLQKLKENSYIEITHTFDNPTIGYYHLTRLGKMLIYDLAVLVKSSENKEN